MSSIAENYSSIGQQIKLATQKAGRDANAVTLLAVSKTRTAEDIRGLYQLGQRQFGENYTQEALEKIAALSDLPIIWHFIGPIQSNKSRSIAEHFDWVHSVDRLKIAKRLSEQRPSHLPALNICVQVNISHELSKSGCLPESAEALLNQIAELPNLSLRGLMTIPAATTDKTEQRQALASMKHLFETLQKKHPSLDTLSMGMSNDMEIAIQEGATMVRIGTALFGPRS